MGRMQCKGKGKGISSTVTPFKRRAPRWVAHTPKTIVELITAMAKKGLSPSQIGVQIRDNQAVPSIKLLTGQKIVRVLKKNGTILVMQDALPKSPKTSTASSRKPSTSEGTYKNAKRTRMPSTGSFSSSPRSTDLAATTGEPRDSPTSGSTTPRPPQPWSRPDLQ